MFDQRHEVGGTGKLQREEPEARRFMETLINSPIQVHGTVLRGQSIRWIFSKLLQCVPTVKGISCCCQARHREGMCCHLKGNVWASSSESLPPVIGPFLPSPCPCLLGTPEDVKAPWSAQVSPPGWARHYLQAEGT